MEYVDKSQQVAVDYNLTPQKTFIYLHNLLPKYSKSFYFERVSTYAQTFQQAVNLGNREYNYPIGQMRVNNYLHSLRISEFLNQGEKASV